LDLRTLLVAIAVPDALLAIALGVVSALLVVAALFAIKPRLRLTYRDGRFRVENNSLSMMVKVEARLFLMTKEGEGPWERRKIPLEVESLSQFNGLWRELRRSSEDRRRGVGERVVDFTPRGDCFECALRKIGTNGDDARMVFHIWGDHAFTNSGRLSRLRIENPPSTWNPACSRLDVEAVPDDSRDWPLHPAAAIVRRLNKRKHARWERANEAKHGG
jgi:hypothetical protein